MSIELTLLIWSVALAIIQMLIAFIGITLEFGLPDLPGGHQKLPPANSFPGRAQSASHNMLQSLVPFAALVLVAEVANRTNASTGLGVEVFFVSRLVYAVIGMIGLPWLRTAVWCVSMAAMLLILAQLV
jgi:uncharacterized MAPEG superfamily protein